MCNSHTSKNKSVARILFAGFFGIICTLIFKILLDAQIRDHKIKLSTTPNAYDAPQNKTNSILLYLVSKNFDSHLQLLNKPLKVIFFYELPFLI